MIPDTMVFTVAFSTYFGVERAFYQLAHNLVLSLPGLSWLRKFGTVAASQDNARKALSSGAALLVYPGGDYEVHRPSWQGNRVDFGGRKGFIRLALDQDVPIVPVVAIGGQETALFLTRGERLARLLALDRVFRLKVLPISLSLPWIVNIGDFGHIPLPAKITIETLPAIDLRAEFGPDPDRRRGLRPSDAPDAGCPRRARRRAALPGARMRINDDIAVAGADRGRVVDHRRPRARAQLHVGRHPLGGRRRRPDRPRRPLPDAVPDRRRGGRRADRGGRVRRAARVRVDVDHRARPARPLAPARSPGRPHARRAPPRLRHRRRRHQRLAGGAHRRPERLAATSARPSRQLGRLVEQEQLRERAARRRAGARRAGSRRGQPPASAASRRGSRSPATPPFPRPARLRSEPRPRPRHRALRNPPAALARDSRRRGRRISISIPASTRSA